MAKPQARTTKFAARDHEREAWLRWERQMNVPFLSRDQIEAFKAGYRAGLRAMKQHLTKQK